MKRNGQGGLVAPEPGGYQRGSPVMGAGIESMVAGERSWVSKCEHEFKLSGKQRCRHCSLPRADFRRAKL